MSYNFLRDARTIENSFLCMYDTLDGYSSDFYLNGNVDGWDIYNNIYLYGCWSNTLFGTCYDTSCYISRTNVFGFVEAEDYYYLKILMKITVKDSEKSLPTTGRVQWLRVSDDAWNTDKQYDFTITADDKWHLVTVNLGPAQWWQGNINNMRIYPFIDGHFGDQFAIRYIKISSMETYKCTNTQCSYYTQYTHPCPGAGARGTCEAGTSKTLYSTVEGSSDDLIVNIDDYGDVSFKLGTNTNLTGIEMARVMSNKISSLNIGGYNFSQVEYSELDKLKITSGTAGSTSSVLLDYSAAAVALGFYDDTTDISAKTGGTTPATGFDYASSRLLTAYEINKLIDGDTESFAYVHNPDQYNVEGGRRDFNEIGIARLLSDVSGNEYYDSLNNAGRTLIDLSHPINNNGRLKAIYMYGRVDSSAKFKIFRPKSNGDLEMVYSLSMPTEDSNYLYTTVPIVYRVDCDILVNKGDLIGIYNANLYVGVSINGIPDATFYQVDGDITGTIEPGKLHSYGLAGFAIYARGDRWQTSTIIDIDFGDRINIEEVNVYGNEEAEYFEYNIASCEDLTWGVDLFGKYHYHTGTRWTDGYPFWDNHLNIAYGIECLNDSIRTADNGQVGTGYGKDSNGLYTTGTDHSYFYVNGDAEWLYNYVCTGKSEYCWPYVPNGVFGFAYDPIAFYLTFPYGFRTEVHKSIIYFKERNNFRQIALSTYLGYQDSTGNADSPHYKLVPRYTSIKLDGITFLPDGDDAQTEYIFKNPTNNKVIFREGVAQNWEEFRAASATDWSIIEHNFNPVDCYGYRIYTNFHYSTKITEIEVYSKMSTDPSLADNVSVLFSAYGDVWNTGSFSEISTTKASAHIGAAPRYMRVEMGSSTRFFLNEIEMSVGDQVKLEDCSDVLLLNNSKSQATNKANKIVLTNIYDKPFDLIVDIPKETHENDNIVFWSKLGSTEEIIEPEFGPPCVLHKSDNYEIKNDNAQCAINNPGYGLKNLINDKESYYTYNDEDWFTFGTLSSGIALDFCNTPYYDAKVTEITFTPISSEYWKIDTIDASTDVMPIRDLIAYYQGTRVPIQKLYGFGRQGIYSQTYGFDDNGIYIEDIGSQSGWYDDFEDDDYSRWTLVQEGVTGSSVIEENGYIRTDSFGSGPSWHGPRIHEDIGTDVTTDFRFTTYFSISDTSRYLSEFDIWLRDTTVSGGTDIIQAQFKDNSIYGAWWYLIVYYKGVQQTPNPGVLVSADLTRSTDPLIFNQIDIIRVKNELIINVSNNEAYRGAISTGDVINNYKMGFHEVPGAGAYSMKVGYVGWQYEPFIGSVFGFKLPTSDPIDTLKLVHFSSQINTINIYTSNNNTNNYLLAGTGTDTYSNIDSYARIAIDLEKRHDLEIIRNYGSSTYKYFLSTSVGTDFSNTVTSNVDSVDWDNSDKDDVRWLRINLPCDDAFHCVRKLGVYPDIASAYCIGGGYNCEWQSLSTIFTDYTPSINVAFGATITGTGIYWGQFYPFNAIDGISNDYASTACWGFEIKGGFYPFLELDLGDTYLIHKMNLYHGYDPSDSNYINTDYTLGVSTTSSGDNFSTILTVSSNSDHDVIHRFDPVSARRVKLTITGYDTTRFVVIDPDTGAWSDFEGGFLREMEVYTYVDPGYVNSEDWPVVCINLRDQFNVVGHELVNKDPSDTDTDWNNADEFFRYSDNQWNEPYKISFSRGGAESEQYSTSDSTYGRGILEYTFDTNIYLPAGRHQLECQFYAANYDEEVSIRLQGPDLIDLFSDQIVANWVDYSNTLEISIAGFYSIKAVQHFTAENNWGARNIYIYRVAGFSKWMAVTRDTATNYSYDDDSGKYGKDYLSYIKTYGDTKYRPTEYSWWWSSNVSTLANNGFHTKVGSRSLEISYPSISGSDTLSFIEGDNFGIDSYWSVKDRLHFYWYIDDVSNLDTNFGDITFGILNTAEPKYYTWYIRNLSLHDGWNDFDIKFEDYDYINPQIDDAALLNFIDRSLDLRTNGENMQSFRMRYRGLGNNVIKMYIDDITIKRNKYIDDVKFNKGLCLTGTDYLEIPVSDISLEKGSVEFWLKGYYDSYGRDLFNNILSRVLFTMVNNNNDLISVGIKSGNWYEVNVGHVRKALISSGVEDNNDLPVNYFIEKDEIIHMALVWSNDGLFMDNGDTIRFYLNNQLVYSSRNTWEVEDTKSANLKLGGGNTQLALNQDMFGGAVFDNVKIYNYCKSDFNITTEGIANEIVYTPNEFLEISSDNINFYGRDSDQTPLIFQQVPAGSSRTVYVRSNKDDTFKLSKKTASLIISWLTTV